MKQESNEDIRSAVREVYGNLVKQGGNPCCPQGVTGKKSMSRGYTQKDLEEVPQAANLGLGCGNPLAFAGVQEGQTVLDLGSGAGMDCFIASGKVGPAGKVIGLDMTGEMVDEARRLARENGYENVEFVLGTIEDMPLENDSVDWVISNCVVNLSPEKDKVFAEVFRVLKPGGNILISDVVMENMPAQWKGDIAAWAACVAGALSEDTYLSIIARAGFVNVAVEERQEFMHISDPETVTISSIRVSGLKPHTKKQIKEETHMGKKDMNLDTQTQLLISAGAAVAAGCIPCLQTIVKMAREAGIEEWKLKAAVKTGQFVKDKPIEMMKACADELLGTHLQTREGKERLVTCPAKVAESAGSCGSTGEQQTAGKESGGCSC